MRNCESSSVVEPYLAKVVVAGSSPVSRSRIQIYRGMEQLVARRAHNPKVTGSSPVPATIYGDYSLNARVAQW